ncbi:MAG: zinc-binding alcohol dehydrogenase, partial [Actinomycetota bacterium]|nr:zinc-binding alcohol dehydrogenase [Actinomycetota bacterium]
MRALRLERSLPRFAAARLASGWNGRAGADLGPVRLVEVAAPELPGPGWHRVRPHLAGICGSDLATIAGRSSRWFEPIVSFPFVNPP